ncbi:hypothetical protein ZWY2020_014083 [Hordeum vulgare]|nr:hypothetical protein ZWY2020_014083 [Hordeum vulgare]
MSEHDPWELRQALSGRSGTSSRQRDAVPQQLRPGQPGGSWKAIGADDPSRLGRTVGQEVVFYQRGRTLIKTIGSCNTAFGRALENEGDKQRSLPKEEVQELEMDTDEWLMWINLDDLQGPGSLMLPWDDSYAPSFLSPVATMKMEQNISPFFF